MPGIGTGGFRVVRNVACARPTLGHERGGQLERHDDVLTGGDLGFEHGDVRRRAEVLDLRELAGGSAGDGAGARVVDRLAASRARGLGKILARHPPHRLAGKKRPQELGANRLAKVRRERCLDLRRAVAGPDLHDADGRVAAAPARERMIDRRGRGKGGARRGVALVAHRPLGAVEAVVDDCGKGRRAAREQLAWHETHRASALVGPEHQRFGTRERCGLRSLSTPRCTGAPKDRRPPAPSRALRAPQAMGGRAGRGSAGGRRAGAVAPSRDRGRSGPGSRVPPRRSWSRTTAASRMRGGRRWAPATRGGRPPEVPLALRQRIARFARSRSTLTRDGRASGTATGVRTLGSSAFRRTRPSPNSRSPPQRRWPAGSRCPRPCTPLLHLIAAVLRLAAPDVEIPA